MKSVVMQLLVSAADLFKKVGRKSMLKCMGSVNRLTV